jgi:hypothetical protein
MGNQMNNKARIVIAAMSIIIGAILIIVGLCLINLGRTGAISEISVMEECSTGVLLGIGGFILTATGLNRFIRAS